MFKIELIPNYRGIPVYYLIEDGINMGSIPIARVNAYLATGASLEDSEAIERYKKYHNL